MVKYSRKHCKKGRNKSRRMRGGVETPEAAETAADGFFSAFSTAKAAALQEEAAAAVKAETAALQAEAEKTTNDVTNFATDAKTNLSTQFSDVTGVVLSNPFSSKNEVAPAPVPVLSIPGSGTETGTAPVPEATETAGGEVEKSWFSSFWKGGKHGSNHMRGGQKLGLNYYATPVHGIKMADPTYMEYYKGGKRSRKRSTRKRSTSKRSTRKRSTRKRRSCKRRKCRKTCNKRHRHCRK